MVEQVNPLNQLPSPASIHHRLGELLREKKLLERLLRVALDLHKERHRERLVEREVARAK